MLNNNPDTRESVDLGIRRTRILMHGQITPKLLVFWIVGVNNQTFTSGGLQGGDVGGGTSGIDGKRPQVFVHDSWGEYTFNKHVQVGGGMLTWSGLSRMTNAATLNFLMIDAPIYNWTTIDATDQFARTMGAYAKGVVRPLQLPGRADQAIRDRRRATGGYDRAGDRHTPRGWRHGDRYSQRR